MYSSFKWHQLVPLTLFRAGGGRKTTWNFLTFPTMFFQRLPGFFFVQKFILESHFKHIFIKCQKWCVKEVIISKKVFHKCPKFYKLGDSFFFILTKFQKCGLKGSKKARGKKVNKSKNDRNESWPKFYKLGDGFLLFDEIIINSRVKKNIFPILHMKHMFSALEPSKMKIMNQNFKGMLI